MNTIPNKKDIELFTKENFTEVNLDELFKYMKDIHNENLPFFQMKYNGRNEFIIILKSYFDLLLNNKEEIFKMELDKLGNYDYCYLLIIIDVVNQNKERILYKLPEKYQEVYDNFFR